MRLARLILFFVLVCVAQAAAAGLDQQLAVIRPERAAQERARQAIDRYVAGLAAPDRAGLERILQSDLFSGRQVNHALDLFVQLLERGAVRPGDTITMALALANNHMYSIGDEAVRTAVRSDALAHFGLYREILAWHKGQGVRLDLELAPLAAKVYWATRSRGIPERAARSRVLTLPYYREFVDSIESLRFMQALVKRIWPARVQSTHGLAGHLEAWCRIPSNLEYRAAIDHLQRTAARGRISPDLAEALREYDRGDLYETEYFGKKRRWDGYGWLNYQVRRLASGKKIRGDCYTITTMQINLYKAAGIPAFGEQVWSVNPKFYHHNSPRFFHPVWRRWISIQQPADDPQGYYNYFDKPVWHHRQYEQFGHTLKQKDGLKVWSVYWPGERVSSAVICSHRALGFTEGDLDRLFWGRETLTEGVIFNGRTVPSRVPDADGDGIPDPVEAALGTNPRSVDTDGDGISDQFELDSGSDPRSTASPARPVFPLLDGIGLKERTLPGMTTLEQPAGRHEAEADIHDIRSLTAGIVDGQLYAGIRYHNDIRFNQSKNRTLRVTAVGNDTRHWFIQWSGGVCRVYRVHPDRTGDAGLELISTMDWPMATMQETEMLVPLTFFSGAKTLFVWYQSTGIKNGKRSNSIAVSKKVRLDLDGGTALSAIRTALEEAVLQPDPAGDARGGRDTWDISGVRIRILGNRLFLRVSYHAPVTALMDVLHSLDLRDSSDRNRRLFFQTRDMASCNLYEGEAKTVLGPDRFAWYRDGNDLVFACDISRMAGVRAFEVRYRAGSGDSDRDRAINSDLAGYFKIVRE